LEQHVAHLVVRAVIRHHFAGPCQLQDVQAFVELRCTDPSIGIVGVDARVAAVPRATEPDGEYQTAVRQVVERESFTRDFPRTSPREREHHRAKSDPCGDHRHRTQHDPRIEDIAGFYRNIVPDEDAVPPVLLCVTRQIYVVVN
jgi:hypothetical protein